MDKSLEVKINHLTEEIEEQDVTELEAVYHSLNHNMKHVDYVEDSLYAMIRKTEQKLNALEADLDRSIMRLRGAVAIAIVIGIWAVVYALIT